MSPISLLRDTFIHSFENKISKNIEKQKKIIADSRQLKKKQGYNHEIVKKLNSLELYQILSRIFVKISKEKFRHVKKMKKLPWILKKHRLLLLLFIGKFF